MDKNEYVQMVRMEQDNILATSASRFVTNALDVVRIRFVSSWESAGDVEAFAPEFAHQHFGEKETIYGYNDLHIVLNYTDASMFLYPEVSFSATVSAVEKDMKEDDVMAKIKDQLPSDQMNMMVEAVDAFHVLLSKQKNFKPFGELISKLSAGAFYVFVRLRNIGGKCFELYKISESSPAFDAYLTRVQSLALWYIDAAQYTDNSDPLWFHYFLFESRANDSGDGSRAYSLAGYASLYRFYAYPDRVRPRIAQIMLLPPYRKRGLGAKLLDVVYKDLCSMKEVLDVTAEDPADNFVYLRDYVDCINCSKLPEFAPDNLKGGFTEEMRTAALNKLKITKVAASYVNADQKMQQLQQLYEEEVETSHCLDWISAHKKKLEVMKIRDEAYDQLQVLEKVKERLSQATFGVRKRERKRRLRDDGNTEEFELQNDASVDNALPEEYMSDDEVESKPEEPLKVVKVYYASRTHSQLDQLLEELHKTRFSPRIVTAASRQILCVNEDVTKLKFSHLINERCMELRKGCAVEGKRIKLDEKENPSCLKKTSSKCPYYKSDSIEELSNEMLAGTLRRTNEVVDRAKELVACPYFSTRLSLPLSQLVLLPYQVVLHASSRAAWGIDLKGNVLILDEAHNVLETIGSLYSAEVTSTSTTLALSLIREYLGTYKSRLKSKSLLYMKQLMAVVAAFDHYLRRNSNTLEDVLTIQGFVIALGLTDVNFFKIVHYMESTDMCRKFHGFFIRSMKSGVSTPQTSASKSGIAKLMAAKNSVHVDTVSVEDDKARSYPSPLFTIKAFLEALSNRCEDGRIIVEKKGNASKFRFILLNPASRLMEVVKEARATILIGGTMEPAGLLVDCLSRGGVENGIRRFSCSHVIDDHQLLALAIGHHVRNEKFTLTFETRGNVQCVELVAETLMLLIREVPNGCVVFFTSYDYMAQFMATLEKFKISNKCKMKKLVFVESRGASGDIWDRFVAAARVRDGAVLFAVAGGKLSEDDSANGEDYVFKELVKAVHEPHTDLCVNYLDSQVPGGGNQLYQSLCMHVINQAIGRAIRHRKDYAMVYLVDSRYQRHDVISKLPGWISKRLKCPNSFPDAVSLTREFFEGKRTCK
ncbi:ATP-dependent DNA helicase chl-1 [Trichostrongylus colubriformis]|uniref:Histone acetyltransferase type B catalytic subunit n=1 Tax=Trichostrongylus colubriformis TaxID=6319 RepID=A0AAN8ISU5_TRICO